MSSTRQSRLSPHPLLPRLPMRFPALFLSLFLAALLIAPTPLAHAHAIAAEAAQAVGARAPGPRSAASTSACKAVPGTPDWPAPSAWAQLNESTGGRLLRPAPPGAVCHPGQPTYDAGECPAVQSAWKTQFFHQADPVSSMWQQWNNDTCLPNATDPCSGQGYPVFVINATTAQHVKAGVDFAREHNVRLIVKSSGHDYLGRSSAPNSLSIWVHHMKGTELHDTFTPKGCPCSVKYNTSITAAGGSQDIDMYEATAAVGQIALGGGGEGVAVGGYLTGGGHSPFSATHGLGADQVLEMEIVTPQGEILTLNECQNTDLFWAMRGGGGSTFGVLTSVTVKTFPSPSLVNYLYVIGTTDYTSPVFWDMIAYVISQFPSLGDAGVTGYSYWYPETPYPYGNTTITVAGMLGDFMVQDTQDESVIENFFNPIWEHINATWPGVFTLNPPELTLFSSFIDWYAVHYDMSAAGLDEYVGSRLLSKEAVTSNLTAAAAAYKQFSLSGLGTAYLVSGKGVFNAKPPGGGDAVCPAWRTSYIHATTGGAFPPLDPVAKAEAFALLDYQVSALRALDPTSGAYVNEANPYEPNFQQTFWGDNYPRLLDIKRAVDPDDVLWCTPCVGNERWQEVGDQLCRV